MNPLLETIASNSLALDTAGIIGLGLVGLAALGLARQQRSWGGTMIALGALAVLLARFYHIFSPLLTSNDALEMMGPVGISLTLALPPLLLSFGLAGVVWGLWGHERWLRAEG